MPQHPDGRRNFHNLHSVRPCPPATSAHTVDGMLEPPRVLVIGAHADDEILGCGATLAVHAERGADITILLLSTSITSRDSSDADTVAAHRLKCAQTVADLYGARLHTAELPDNRFDTVDQLTIVQHIETVIADCQPEVVYTHSLRDLSRDHQLVAHATATATRPQPGSPVKTVLSYEVRSATDWAAAEAFQPRWHQPLTPDAIERKLMALDVYASEMRPWPHSRSIRAVHAHLASRGATIGTEAAEAFEVLRHIA
jgi:LmbE family N-acetylglucosaminyl deacetylase